MMSISSRFSQGSAHVRFLGKSDEKSGNYRIQDPTEQERQAAEKKQIVKDARKRHGKGILGGFGVMTAALAAMAGLIGSTVQYNDKASEINATMPQVQFEEATNPNLTKAGNEALASGQMRVVLDGSDITQLDEFFSTVVVQMAEESGTQVSEEDVLRRVELLEEKQPQIMQLYQQLNQNGDAEDPEKLFFGLVDILGEDLSTDQQSRFKSEAREYFDENLADHVGAFGSLGDDAGVIFPSVILGILALCGFVVGTESRGDYRRAVRRGSSQRDY